MHDAPSKPATDDAIQIAATVFAPGSRRLVWSSKNPQVVLRERDQPDSVSDRLHDRILAGRGQGLIFRRRVQIRPQWGTAIFHGAPLPETVRAWSDHAPVQLEL